VTEAFNIANQSPQRRGEIGISPSFKQLLTERETPGSRFGLKKGENAPQFGSANARFRPEKKKVCGFEGGGDSGYPRAETKSRYETAPVEKLWGTLFSSEPKKTPRQKEGGPEEPSLLKKKGLGLRGIHVFRAGLGNTRDTVGQASRREKESEKGKSEDAPRGGKSMPTRENGAADMNPVQVQQEPGRAIDSLEKK